MHQFPQLSSSLRQRHYNFIPDLLIELIAVGFFLTACFFTFNVGFLFVRDVDWRGFGRWAFCLRLEACCYFILLVLGLWVCGLLTPASSLLFFVAFPQLSFFSIFMTIFNSGCYCFTSVRLVLYPYLLYPYLLYPYWLYPLCNSAPVAHRSFITVISP